MGILRSGPYLISCGGYLVILGKRFADAISLGLKKALAPHHLSTRFLRIDVEHAPFLVTKLGIKVLPCVIAFVDGVSVDRIVGFEGLGYSESTFTTGDLEKRLVGCGVLENERGLGDVKARRGREERGEEVEEDGGDDDEWD